MNAVFDFTRSALPWLVIGFTLAITLTSRSKGSEKMKKAYLLPSIGMFVIAVMDFWNKETSSATVWLVLGIFFVFLSLAEKKEEKESEDKQ